MPAAITDRKSIFGSGKKRLPDDGADGAVNDPEAEAEALPIMWSQPIEQSHCPLLLALM